MPEVLLCMYEFLLLPFCCALNYLFNVTHKKKSKEKKNEILIKEKTTNGKKKFGNRDRSERRKRRKKMSRPQTITSEQRRG